MSSRTMLLIMTVALLVVGVYLVTQKGISATYAGGFIKAGLVTGALWLALPQLTSFFTKTPRWLLIGGGIGIAIATMNWQLLILIVPVVAALWFFAPRLIATAKTKILPTVSATPPPPGRRARRKREAE
ncbi:MAG: hypothetical protein IAF94_22380 [Pirellulaceae bacterium]|nr:hypothetical protein [Pirellulaceae bacterium]